MEIQKINSTLTFGAKNKKIKEADDIARLSKSVFPMQSSTRLKNFSPQIYNSRITEIRDSIYKLIYKIKDSRDRIVFFPNTYPYENILETVKKDKVGNCHESAITSLAALAANGYTNARMADLVLETSYINKRTKQTEYKTIKKRLDHVLVITTMDKKKTIEDAEEKDLVVIDTWAGFCDSASKAKELYKSIFYTDCVLNTNNGRSKFMQETNRYMNLDDYEIRHNFSFMPCDNKYTIEDIAKLQERFKELIKKPQNNQATVEQGTQGTFSVQI